MSKDIEEQKKQSSQRLKLQTKLHWMFEKKKREDYSNAYSERCLEEIDYDYQATMIMEIIKGWAEAIDPEKKPKQHKELNAIFSGALTMYVYKESQRRKMATAIVEMKSAQMEASKKQIKIQELQKEIKSLKSVIEFNEKN